MILTQFEDLRSSETSTETNAPIESNEVMHVRQGIDSKRILPVKCQ